MALWYRMYEDVYMDLETDAITVDIVGCRIVAPAYASQGDPTKSANERDSIAYEGCYPAFEREAFTQSRGEGLQFQTDQERCTIHIYIWQNIVGKKSENVRPSNQTNIFMDVQRVGKRTATDITITQPDFKDLVGRSKSQKQMLDVKNIQNLPRVVQDCPSPS